MSELEAGKLKTDIRDRELRGLIPAELVRDRVAVAKRGRRFLLVDGAGSGREIRGSTVDHVGTCHTSRGLTGIL
jgi:hypothetical protein